MHIAITGGTGYIGEALTKRLLERGHTVRCLSRRRPSHQAVEYAHYDLTGALNNEALIHIDCIIHLACDTTSNDPATSDTELRAAQQLLDAALAKRIFFLYASSLSATPDATTGYGKNKYGIERCVQQSGGTVIRPGFVYGGDEKGLYGVLCRIVRHCPVLPDFRPALNLQPVHIDDLASAILTIVEKKLSGDYTVAQDEPVSLTRFLALIARHKIGRKRLFVPVPWRLLLWFKQFLPVGMDPDRLLSLSKTPHRSSRESLAALGMTLQSLEDSFRR